MSKLNPEFIVEFNTDEDFNPTTCINCGTCSGLCPIGLDSLPRKLGRYIVLGLEDKILEEKESYFLCLLCKLCVENCPTQVNIASNVRTARNYINRKIYKI
ncbi:MAG: 4Fe-4S dicluster domain-containing protein [Bacteroidales bacterium]